MKNRVKPGPGQESVWDYPRPPRIEICAKEVRVELEGKLVCLSKRALRCLETSHPPAIYIPASDFTPGALQPNSRTSFCEWKGEASYWDIKIDDREVFAAGWSYPSPNSAFGVLSGLISLYPSKFECFLNGERVQSQEGDFYGGWITSEIVGPFKGGAGTSGW